MIIDWISFVGFQLRRHSFAGMVHTVSRMASNSEAMLIFLLVVTWHIYDSC